MWEEQWSYLGPAPSTIREGLTDYWEVATPSGRSADARNFALALADAVQAVYEDGIGCTMSTTTQSEGTTYIRYQLTVRPRNYFGGYSLTLSGLPSGSTVSTGDGDLSNLSASGYTSSQATGTDTVTITVPKASASRSFTMTATATPYVRQYRSNSAVGFLRSGSGSYQDVLFAGGSLSAAPVTGRVTRTVPALPDGSITVKKLEAESKEPVPGVVFALYEYDGSDYADTGKTAVSNASGVASFTGLQYSSANRGLYRVFEVSSDTHQVWTSPYVCWVSLASGQWYYSATLRPDEAVTYGDAGNPNDVTLTWSRTTGGYYDTLSDEAKVYSYALDLTKVLDEGGTAFSEVQFTLENRSDETGFFYLTAEKAEDGVYYVTGGTNSAEEAAHFSPNSQGKLLIYGLEEDLYELVEVKTASGYTLLKDSIFILISTGYTVNQPCGSLTASAAVDGNDAEMTSQGDSVHALVPLTVLNHRGFDLPKTGGAGTLVTTVCGALLLSGMAALAVVLVRKKKS